MGGHESMGRYEGVNPITIILDYCKPDDNDPEHDSNIAWGQLPLVLSSIATLQTYVDVLPNPEVSMKIPSL